MSFQAPITIKKALEGIEQKKYLLPAIQREFVWKTRQIERLFDSLMRDYPIGSFLFWSVNGDKIKDFQFYEFVRSYHERDSRHNIKADMAGVKEITAILDGQQRLTALYIGLKGTYAVKLPNKRWDNDQAYPKRQLYLNLLSREEDEDKQYRFDFLTEDESKERDDDCYWFKVGDILDFNEEADVNEYLIRNKLMEAPSDQALFANRTLFRLFTVINKDLTLNYFLEEDESLDKVLNIFIRVNSGGTLLSYSDLLLSIATAQWEKRDAREEINSFVDEVNGIGRGFNIDKDFVLKSCLVLCDMDMQFKVDNFNHENMLQIEEEWIDLTKAIRLAFELITSYGFHRDTLTSNNAVIPISYFLKRAGSPHNFVGASSFKDERDRIQEWLVRSLLKRAFGGQPDTVLKPIRQIIKNNGEYPLDEIIEHFRGTNRNLLFDDDEIENLFYNKYGHSFTFSTLALLYPSLDFKNIFHQDHIFPKSRFTYPKLRKAGIPEDRIESYVKYFNTIINLQLLEGIPNHEKSDMDFKEWLDSRYPKGQERKDYMEKHYIPDGIDLSFDNFLEFAEARKALLRKKYIELLRTSR